MSVTRWYDELLPMTLPGYWTIRAVVIGMTSLILLIYRQSFIEHTQIISNLQRNTRNTCLYLLIWDLFITWYIMNLFVRMIRFWFKNFILSIKECLYEDWIIFIKLNQSRLFVFIFEALNKTKSVIRVDKEKCWKIIFIRFWINYQSSRQCTILWGKCISFSV